MNLKLIPYAAALLLSACAASAPKPEAPASTATVVPVADHPELSDDDRKAFFVNFARGGDKASVEKELAAGIDVNSYDSLGQTALIAAVSHSAPDVVNLLLAHHADPNLADNAGWTPLHYATYFGAGNELLAALLKAGAKIDARNDRGITALYFATALAHGGQVAFLLAQGADKSIASNAGYTPLKLAQTKGFDAIAALLDPSLAKKASGAN